MLEGTLVEATCNRAVNVPPRQHERDGDRDEPNNSRRHSRRVVTDVPQSVDRRRRAKPEKLVFRRFQSFHLHSKLKLGHKSIAS